MSTRNKKGFTLIELMVVIVIIGILAAIAIPKLFGMSAKAKAQEVGPAMGSWAKMQQAYKMETGDYGRNDSIGYKMPGDTTAYNVSKTSNFGYDLSKDNGRTYEAESRFKSDPCPDSTVWSATFVSAPGDDPIVDIASADCKSLTPQFCNIGSKVTGNTTCK